MELAAGPGGGVPNAAATKPVKADTTSKYDVDEHLKSPVEVASSLGTSIDVERPASSQGLSAAEAAARLAKNGLNKLTPPPTRPEWLKFLLQFTDPLLLLLIVAAALTFGAYGYDTSDSSNIILAVLLLVLTFVLGATAYIEERHASNVAASLGKLLPQATKVLRDGKEVQVEATQLVVGDVVHLTLGDRCPADIRVFETMDLKADQSSLTGEQDPIPIVVDSQHHDVTESRNMVFMTSLVLNGEGRGIVVRTGDATFIGSVANMASKEKGEKSTLQKDVEQFVIFIAVLAVSWAVIMFAVGWGRTKNFIFGFVNGIVVVLVAFIPQGLPASVSSCLSITAQRMRVRNVVIKRVDIVEALGSATRIASDKTGTLTQNKMTVMNCWVNRQYKSARDVVSLAHGGAVLQEGVLNRVSSRTGGLDRKSITYDRYSLGQAAQPTSISRLSRKSGTSGYNVVGKGQEGIMRTSMLVKGGNMQAAIPEHEVDSGIPAPQAVVPLYVDQLSRMSAQLPLPPREAQVAHLGRLSKISRASMGGMPGQHTFGLLSFADPNAISWDICPPFTRLLTIASVCNRAKFADNEGLQVEQDAAERKVFGDATDAGLLRFVERICPADSVRDAFPKVFEIPFNSRNKWALVMCSMPNNPDSYVVFLKGAPEIVIDKCTRYYYQGVDRELDEAFQADMMEAYDSFGCMAERVIGFTYKVVSKASVASVSDEDSARQAGLIGGFTFCGLLSLIDPPRDAVPPAVQECRLAGINVTMVTGDHPITAEAIARKCGIITLPTRKEVAAQLGVDESSIPYSDPRVGAIVMSGAQVTELGEDIAAWDEVLSKMEIVFARTTPQHKADIVKNFKRRGEIVAVTGDGVNDAPALSTAHIGVAMGNPDSSDVAREAASVILLDDNFASLVAAIEEGRTLYDNLKKTIAYTVTHTVPELIPVILSLALGMPLGLNALLTLSIDLVTEQGPAISLAYEPAEASVMARPPRNTKTDRLVMKQTIIYAYVIVGLVQGGSALAAYFGAFLYHHVPVSSMFLSDTDCSKSASDLTINDTCYFTKDTEKNQPLCVDGFVNGVCPAGSRLFSPDEQAHILGQAQAATYITIVLSQFWHIWFCKTRFTSVFVHKIFANMVTVYGTMVELTAMFIIVYVPWLQTHVFNGYGPPGVCYIPMLFFGLFIGCYTEFNKWSKRNHPDWWWPKISVW